GSSGMTEVEPVLDFASSGRSGRRNALPDILGSPAGVNPSDLPLKLAELSLTGQAQWAGWSSVAYVRRGLSACRESGGKERILNTSSPWEALQCRRRRRMRKRRAGEVDTERGRQQNGLA
ncbi:hypothetical protein P4O66_018822, partial [Electrophorus voltai]